MIDRDISILLAEDDPDDVVLTLEGLSAEKLDEHVVVVNDGAEALDYVFRRGSFSTRQSGDPTVILLDIKMPRIDGLGVLRAIREDEEKRQIPIVMLTSSKEESDLLQSYALGANAFVVKPFKFEDYVDVVRRLGVFWGRVNEPPPRNEGGST